MSMVTVVTDPSVPMTSMGRVIGALIGSARVASDQETEAASVIISKGRLVANGSLEELRAGVALQSLDDARATHDKLTLEEIFLNTVGNGQDEAVPELSWLA